MFRLDEITARLRHDEKTNWQATFFFRVGPFFHETYLKRAINGEIRIALFSPLSAATGPTYVACVYL